VELTFPSKLFKEAAGLRGRVEYPMVDVTKFSRGASRTPSTDLVIGRHGRDDWLKFHPNDPSFLRALLARGHRVRILGGTCIAPAFVHDPSPRLELLPVGAEDATQFLNGLDVFIYRKHPEFFETGGTVILEAMAMELPVIVFAGQCGVAELIEHGRNGYLVSSEAEAIEFVDRLSAARNTVVEVMRRNLLGVITPLTCPPDVRDIRNQGSLNGQGERRPHARVA
jgi:glycosyltransferase involved in cell wall biosynthesis